MCKVEPSAAAWTQLWQDFFPNLTNASCDSWNQNWPARYSLNLTVTHYHNCLQLSMLAQLKISLHSSMVS